MTTGSLHKKLFNVRKKIGKMIKDSTNPFYNSAYFDINQLIEHLDPILFENELLLLQPIEENKVKSIIIDIESNDKVESSIDLPTLTDPQKIGSAITYYRRYSLQSLLGIQADDDDANKASDKKNTSTSKNNWLNVKNGDSFTEDYKNVCRKIKEGVYKTVQDVRKDFSVSKTTEKSLESAFNKYKNT